MPPRVESFSNMDSNFMMQSMSELFADLGDGTAAFTELSARDEFMSSLRDLMDGEEFMTGDNFQEVCAKMQESFTRVHEDIDFNNSISKLFGSFSDLAQSKRAFSSKECRNIQKNIERLRNIRQRIKLTKAYRPDFSGFPRQPHHVEHQNVSIMDTAMTRKKGLTKILECALEEWKEESFHSDTEDDIRPTRSPSMEYRSETQRKAMTPTRLRQRTVGFDLANCTIAEKEPTQRTGIHSVRRPRSSSCPRNSERVAKLECNKDFPQRRTTSPRRKFKSLVERSATSSPRKSGGKSIKTPALSPTKSPSKRRSNCTPQVLSTEGSSSPRSASCSRRKITETKKGQVSPQCSNLSRALPLSYLPMSAQLEINSEQGSVVSSGRASVGSRSSPRRRLATHVNARDLRTRKDEKMDKAMDELSLRNQRRDSTFTCPSATPAAAASKRNNSRRTCVV